MKVHLNLVGVTGHVQHNIRLADPNDEYAKLIRELTSKGTNKTEADLEEIARLEFFGGLYHDRDIGVHVPFDNLRRCLVRGGVITKSGTKVERGISPLTDRFPLTYDGPREPRELWASTEYHFRKMVRVQSGRVVRMRPVFRRWSLELDLELDAEVLSLVDFARIVEQAGRSEGLGEARKIGMGRYVAEVTKA